MAKQFKEAGSGEQNAEAGRAPRASSPVRLVDRVGTGARAGLLVVALLFLVALLAWAARERDRELAPGVPLPAFGRLVAEAGLEPPAGDGCRFALSVPGSPDDAGAEWNRLLLESGWESAGTEDGGARAVYRRSGSRLLAAVDAAGRGTRIRVTIRPCPTELADGARPEVVLAPR